MLFIKRSAGLRKHAGQVGFPGGVVEASDASLLDTGFREAQEEVALRRDSVEVLCPLPTAEVPSGFQLYPYFVATDQQNFLTQESEVESVHLISMTDLLTCPFRLEHKEWNSKVYRVVYFDLDELCVWGVTGRIVEHLLENFFDWQPPR
jgi:8-oxo-dGTP pyrophosphatase MutT (NUDIX family)